MKVSNHRRKRWELWKELKDLQALNNLKRFLLALVNFYRDVWEKRSHILASLSKLSSAKPKDWTWGREQVNVFRKIKEELSKEAILSYPDFDKPFHLYTDASDLQLGATLMQDSKPLELLYKKIK